MWIELTVDLNEVGQQHAPEGSDNPLWDKLWVNLSQCHTIAFLSNRTLIAAVSGGIVVRKPEEIELIRQWLSGLQSL